VRQQPDAAGVRGVIPSLRHPEERGSDLAHFLTAFGRLWACGVPLDTGFLWRGERRARVSLPTYPFQHQRYWIDPGRTPESLVASSTEPRRIDLLSEGFHRPVWKQHPCDPEPAPGQARTWLLFLDTAGFGELLAQRLRARGDNVLVRESDDNRRLARASTHSRLEWARGAVALAVICRDGRDASAHVHPGCSRPTRASGPIELLHRNQERGLL
jgi:acyl transferase domain-containing protein